MKKFKPSQIVSYKGLRFKIADKSYYFKIYPNLRKNSQFFSQMNPNDFADFMLTNDSKEVCSKCKDNHGSYTLVKLGEDGSYIGQESQVCEMEISK